MALAHPDAPLGERFRGARDEFRELGDEARGIASDIGGIARDEARLAVSEVRDGVRATVRAAVWAGIAAAFGLMTLIWIPVPIMMGLDQAMPLWAAALVTVGILLLVTLILGLIAMRQFKHINFVPRGAMDRAKEDVAWLKQQLSRNPS